MKRYVWGPDIFAFGAILYELLTGKRAFGGETITETIASVLKSEPEWRKLPSNTPWRIKELLDDCLQKEAHDRFHDIAHTRIKLQEGLSASTTGTHWKHFLCREIEGIFGHLTKFFQPGLADQQIF